MATTMVVNIQPRDPQQDFPPSPPPGEWTFSVSGLLSIPFLFLLTQHARPPALPDEGGATAEENHENTAELGNRMVCR